MEQKKRQDYYQDDDIISHCGSFSGETFASRHGKRGPGSLRQQSIDLVARKLREQPLEDPERRSTLASIGKAAAELGLAPRRKFNTCFHHFRFLVVIFGGISVGLMFLLRYNITISILRMVNQTHLYLEEHPDRTVEDMIAAGHVPGGEFNWNNEIQQMIMSWYMVAYTLPQMPATKLGLKVGTRLFVPACLALCSVSSLLVPAWAYWGWQWVIVLRLLNGLGAASIFPMLITLIENWMRSDEISLGLSLAQSFVTILTALNPLIAGYLSAIHWSYSFYVPGFATLLFCALWLLLVTDTPMTNHFVSDQELNTIYENEALEALGALQQKAGRTTSKGTSDGKKKKNNNNNNKQDGGALQDDQLDEYKPSSWLQVFKVPSFYAYIIMWCFYCSSYSGFSFILPTYLRQFLKISIAQNGLYCFMVQSGAIVAVLWPYPLIRLLEKRFNLSPRNSHRLAHLILCSVTAFTWIYVGTFHRYQLIMLFFNRCFHNSNDIVVTGNLMSNYAKAGLSGLVFSLVNTVGNLSVVFSSTLIGWLLDYTAQSAHGWQIIFAGLGAAQIIMLLLFTTVVPEGPIKFNSYNDNNNCEARLQRSISSQFERPPDCKQSKENQSAILNVFEKQKEPTTGDAHEPNNESREI